MRRARRCIHRSFNSRLRDQCPNEHVFLSLTEARRIIESWHHDYNFVRSHSSLGALTPMEFVEQQGNGPPVTKLRTPRLVPLLRRPAWGKTSTPDSTHKRGQIGEQATCGSDKARFLTAITARRSFFAPAFKLSKRKIQKAEKNRYFPSPRARTHIARRTSAGRHKHYQIRLLLLALWIT